MTTNYSMDSILSSVIQGDQVAFGKLYRHYRSPALKFCLYLLKDQEEAENMIQDVFIKIWERRSHINPDLNFNSYLFTCLRNMAFDYLKQVEKSQVFKQRYLEQMEMTCDDSDEQENRIQLLEAAVDSLSEKRKKILMLNTEGGKSYQEIAVMMKISKNTVKNQLVKARQLLREKLDLALPHPRPLP